MAAAPAQQHFEAMRSQTEEMLRQRPSRWDTVERLVLLCTGVFLALLGALGRHKSTSDKVTAWVLAAGALLLAGADTCRNLYMRRKLKRVLAEMHAAWDLE